MAQRYKFSMESKSFPLYISGEPAYHRLDLGFDFHHVTKHGHERIWNLSIYNAYCHLNSMYVKVDYDEKTKQFRAKNKGFVPIIPSFSYTIKF